jgi:hypothetical protein
MDATTIKLLSDVLHGGKRASLKPGTMQAVIGVPHQVPHGAGGRAYNADAAGGSSWSSPTAGEIVLSNGGSRMADVNLPAPVQIDAAVTDALIVDLARFAEGLQSEKDIRRRHQLGEAIWEKLGDDDGLIERIEAEKLRRIRSGEAKREKALRHLVTEA